MMANRVINCAWQQSPGMAVSMIESCVHRIMCADPQVQQCTDFTGRYCNGALLEEGKQNASTTEDETVLREDSEKEASLDDSLSGKRVCS